MEQIYEIVGMSIVWTSAIIGMAGLFFYLLYKTIDIIIKNVKNYYILYEFIVYYKEFKEWVKDKQRHKNHKSE